ncbi:MAG: mandelate racemase/muconate lactonizing enzyme family protein [Bryobacteraceae bacterium]|nr:mandelate racemase/muconate lactonizing enzyme family protein [Solibacteraceae bacterium]MCL4841477.1 mandelate racemase/muconate lactonizing enzyme family protein [Bryobacteraceae bacterium]MCO5351449.1 mandelate racemase/muconate lactonizing enzyme family protein [Bryobacteraceae bacterium]
MTHKWQNNRFPTSRRRFLGSAAGAATLGAFWSEQDLLGWQQNVRTASKPSDLRITDLRVAHVVGAPMRCPLIRLETNQGIHGLGEVRDGASPTYALMLKSRLIGENPCDVDRIFRKIKQFGFHARQAGGVCGIEMALWDLAGKAYNVPAYQMLGGKFRDSIRLYCDTTESPDPKIYGQRLKQRRDEGYTFLKMDLGVGLVEKIPGAVTAPLGVTSRNTSRIQHMFTGMELTEKGVALMADYCGAVREVVGWDIPLAADHFGHIGVNSCIRLGKALEKYNLAFVEDMIPWMYTDLWKQITDAIHIPTLTGEDIYLKEPFIELCRNHAVDIVHPDLASSGGLLETKKIGDMAMEYGHAMAMHFAGTPVSFMANLHCAAATENFLALEFHSQEVKWWEDMVTGIDKPIVHKGFAKVPQGPGLGVELNDDVVKQHLAPGTSYFAPSSEWDNERSWDRLYS